MPLIDGLEHKAVRNVLKSPQLVHGPKAKKNLKKNFEILSRENTVSLLTLVQQDYIYLICILG